MLATPYHLLAVMLIVLVLLPVAILAMGKGTGSDCLVLRDYHNEASGLAIRVQNECGRRVEVRTVLFEANGRIVRRDLGITLDPHEDVIVKLGIDATPGSLTVVYSCGGVTRTAVLKITG